MFSISKRVKGDSTKSTFRSDLMSPFLIRMLNDAKLEGIYIHSMKSLDSQTDTGAK